MHLNHIVHKTIAILGAAFLAIALVGCDSADTSSGFAGKYTTVDTQGNPMEITLSSDGGATGTRVGESMTGSWKEEGDTAVITWSTDWTTKITADGDGYKKTAFKGGTMDGSSVAAEKVN